MMLHLLSYQQSPLQLLAVYILQFTPFSFCQSNPYRPTLDTCFQIPFYFSLVYMHPQYMIFDLNLMPPSQSKHSFLIWNANTFQFFIVHEVNGLGPFSLLVKLNLVTSILQNEFVKNIPSSNCGGKYCHVFNTLEAYIYIHLIHLLHSFNHFHCMTLFTSMIYTPLELTLTIRPINGT